ncbi:MAG TPA: hypothetical protein VJQ61_08440 [Sinomonas sp.]|nr:hypothetical protein [Sinomonas sp.]
MSASTPQRLAVRRRLHTRLRIAVLLSVGAFALSWGPALGPVILPLTMALGLAWFLWRSDFESGRN